MLSDLPKILIALMFQFWILDAADYLTVQTNFNTLTETKSAEENSKNLLLLYNNDVDNRAVDKSNVIQLKTCVDDKCTFTCADDKGCSDIRGGKNNEIRTLSSYSGIGGGKRNVIYEDADFSVISGGRDNIITSHYSAIGGGVKNKVFSNFASAGGGYKNQVQGRFSSVVGGRLNTVKARYSLAMGTRAKVSADYSMAIGLLENKDCEIPKDKDGANDGTIRICASGIHIKSNWAGLFQTEDTIDGAFFEKHAKLRRRLMDTSAYDKILKQEALIQERVEMLRARLSQMSNKIQVALGHIGHTDKVFSQTNKIFSHIN